MAFVGITTQMCNEVRSKISGMLHAEISQLGDNPSQAIQITGDEPWLKDRVWEGHAHLIEVLPAKWLHNPESIDFYFYANLGGDGREKHIATKRMSKFDKFPLPPIYRGSNYPTVNISLGDNIPELFKETLEFAAKKREIEVRWSKVTDNVGKFLRNCKSLNEALKLWPDLRIYIPQYYLERVNKKPERKEKQESNAAAVLAEIDTDEIQASAVIARMSGATI
jgi:hypothetical protein